MDGVGLDSIRGEAECASVGPDGVEKRVAGHRKSQARAGVVDVGPIGTSLACGREHMQVAVLKRCLGRDVLEETRDAVDIAEGVGAEGDAGGPSELCGCGGQRGGVPGV